MNRSSSPFPGGSFDDLRSSPHHDPAVTTPPHSSTHDLGDSEWIACRPVQPSGSSSSVHAAMSPLR